MGFALPRLGQDGCHQVGLFQLQLDTHLAQLYLHRFYQGNDFRRPGKGKEPGLHLKALGIPGLRQQAFRRRRVVAVHLWEALLPGGVPAGQVGIVTTHIRVGGPPLIQHLEQLLAIDGLVDGLPHFFFRPRHRRVQSPRCPTALGVAPRLFVLSTEVEPAEDQDDLLGHLSTADELMSLAHHFIGEVLVQLGEVRLPRDELRQTRRLFERPGHLEFFPVHHPVLPVRRRGTLVEHIAVWLPAP